LSYPAPSPAALFLLNLGRSLTAPFLALCRLIRCGLIGFFRSRASLEAEILVLRHQLNVLRRKSSKRPTFGNIDRLIFAELYGLAPNLLSALAIVRPETVIRWHRAGFRLYWRWKSKLPGGRPKLPVEIRTLIRDISLANPLWGAPGIHGELLKLGITIGQTTVAKYMARNRRPPVGRHFCAPTLTGLPRWTYLWSQQSRFSSSMGC
jgi:hypothetical protein